MWRPASQQNGAVFVVNLPLVQSGAGTAPPPLTTTPTITPTTGPSGQPGPSGGVFAPYDDVTLNNRTPLATMADQTGAKFFTLAFVVKHAWGQACDPAWGGVITMDQLVAKREYQSLAPFACVVPT
ncbi:MAG: hypothetical protein MI924_11420 [Chloroflexales bacterium]|nr:hypothetical protein [Chloroflexales bacterium]